MITAVIMSNLAIACFLGFLAVRIWKLRKGFARTARVLDNAERITHNVLCNAPKNIIRGQSGTRNLRQSYQNLETRLQQVQQVVAILTIVLQLGKRQLRRN